MYSEDFQNRLIQLRAKKGASARDMSLSIGQNQSYIYNIESGKALPSMSAFFFICDYLGITPSEFFDLDNPDPARLSTLFNKIKKLNDAEIASIDTLVTNLVNK